MSIQSIWKSFVHTIQPSVILLTCISVLMVGCATATRITTTPPGARVSIDDRYLGESPVIYHDRSGVAETHWISLELNGYKTQTVPIEKTYRADESLITLLFFIIPYFFTARFEEQESYVLERGRN